MLLEQMLYSMTSNGFSVYEINKPFYLSIFVPDAPTWSIGYPWNASFRFSFLILDSR
jgi:hypothetical protein